MMVRLLENRTKEKDDEHRKEADLWMTEYQGKIIDTEWLKNMTGYTQVVYSIYHRNKK